LVDKWFNRHYNSGIETNKATKEHSMENKLTVAELIEILRKMPQGIEVEMAMNMEYQNGVTADMVEVQEYDGRRYLCITDTPGY
jgi:hypothetical protein